MCLGLTGNLQGYYWFLSLCTGRRIKRRTFTPIPVPTRVIDCVHALADADDQNSTLVFFDHLVNPIPYVNTPDDNNEDDAGDLVRVEEYYNKM